ncbi:hypothetical protein QJS10_CPA01g02488 [Acorus calamus]|uniref:Uncharacterized protein n=1 Tax=Acorus calamus TaxID=4465 RepID=A0AAV9FJX4_ACOCL|nr:hypothetical protein QJS10_CPA01g02488 [Acorus calamus]
MAVPIQTALRITARPPPSLTRRPFKFLTRCVGSGGGEKEIGGLISGMVGEEVEALLNRRENRPLLDGLNEASRRVESARAELAEIDRREADNARVKEEIARLESREAERELLEARSMVEEAERSLSSNMGDYRPGEISEIDKEAERWESIKAATVSSIFGTLAGLPISLYQETNSVQLAFHLAVIFVSCALFGVTFRYTIRRDLDNIQLKTGTSAAFGFVKGLAVLEAGSPLQLDTDSLLSHAIDGAVYVSENVFIFLSAAVALDYCFKMR